MKKALLSSFLGLASLALWAAPSVAGTFGLIPCHCWPCGGCGCCCGKCCSTICVRPYNAFSPCCSGTIFCDGCMPLGSPGCGQPACGCPSPGVLNYQGVPGCAEQTAPPPAAAHTQAAPYGGPVQAAVYQDSAPRLPASVTPTAAPWYWTPGGR